ncbi:hypothetical protein D3C87_1094640 [compost metagenome]
MERTKDELVAEIKRICSNAGIMPKIYEGHKALDGRAEIDVALKVDLDNHTFDKVVDDLNALTFNHTTIQVCPCGDMHFGGTPEQAGLKQLF